MSDYLDSPTHQFLAHRAGELREHARRALDDLAANLDAVRGDLDADPPRNPGISWWVNHSQGLSAAARRVENALAGVVATEHADGVIGAQRARAQEAEG